MMDKEQQAIQIVQTLHQHHFEAYLAGGCVRDRLRGIAPKDYDVATSARPEEIQKLFSKTIPVGVQFGVVVVVMDETPFEVATFRSDVSYQDGRHPTEVKFTDVREDAQRRDFTVNGLYFDIKTNQVLDFVGGRADIEKKLIRSIGKAEDRFLEDHLRMLRAVRFAVQLDFVIQADTFDAILENASKIKLVSQERIREEITKTLTSGKPGRGLRLLDQSGLLAQILPEVEKLKGVEQPSRFHPEGDVYVHTLMMLDRLTHAPIELAMGVLLHDIGKPATFNDASDRIRFHGHEMVGAEAAEILCKRLTYSNEQVELIRNLVAQHLRFKDVEKMRLSTLKRFFGMPRFDLHLELHRLDCLASHGDLSAYDFCVRKLDEFAAEPPPPARLVTGDDLIQMGLTPGPEFSDILETVEDHILEGTITTREEALKYVRNRFIAPKK